MAASIIRDQRTWLAYLLIALYGYFLNILGPITPFLKEELALSYTISSLHFTAFAAGMLLVGLLGHYLILTIGRWPSLWLGAAGLSLGAVLLLVGRSPIVTISATFLMGLVGSLILAVVPSLLSEQHGEQRAVALSEANVVASLMSAFAPLMVGWFVGLTGHWGWALAVGAVLPLLFRLIFHRGTTAIPEPARVTTASSEKSLPRIYWVFWTALLLAVAVEFCMVFWSADYLESFLGMSKVSSAQVVSLFLLGMILGRLAGSRLVARFSPLSLVIGLAVLASAGFATFWAALNPVMGVLGLFITGLGVSNLYPLLLSLAIGSARGAADRASARATLASGFAILSLPLVLGRAADLAGIRLAYGVVAILLAGLLAILLTVGRQDIT